MTKGQASGSSRSPSTVSLFVIGKEALSESNTSGKEDGSLRNVVFFGETGVGKSSVINMFREGTTHSGTEIPISNGAVGCTFESTEYHAELNGKRYSLWDTAGLNEDAQGTLPHEESVNNLDFLLHNLGGRIHLLVYCIRGKRFRQVVKENYDLFYKQLCRSQVPIVVVVTGLENEESDMENWWRRNVWEFNRYGLTFDGHACITSTRGKATGNDRVHMFDQEYEESQKLVRSLIERSCSEEGCSVVKFSLHDRIGITDRSSRDPENPGERLSFEINGGATARWKMTLLLQLLGLLGRFVRFLRGSQ